MKLFTTKKLSKKAAAAADLSAVSPAPPAAAFSPAADPDPEPVQQRPGRASQEQPRRSQHRPQQQPLPQHQPQQHQQQYQQQHQYQHPPHQHQPHYHHNSNYHHQPHHPSSPSLDQHPQQHPQQQPLPPYPAPSSATPTSSLPPPPPYSEFDFSPGARAGAHRSASSPRGGGAGTGPAVASLPAKPSPSSRPRGGADSLYTAARRSVSTSRGQSSGSPGGNTTPAARSANTHFSPSSSATPRASRSSADPAGFSFRRSKTAPGSGAASPIHPLNLPPEERLRFANRSTPSFAPLAMAAERADPELDRDASPAAPSSPPTAPTPAGAHAKPNGASDEAGSSLPGMADDDVAPVPPPHRSAPSSPPSTPMQEAELFKAAGNKFFKERDYSRAVEQYSRAVELFPDSATYRSNRAAAYMSAGRYPQALDDCLRAADHDPDNAKINLRLGRIYTALGRPQDALLIFGRIRPAPAERDTAPAREMLHHLTAAQETLRNGIAMSMALHALDQAERLLGVNVARPRKWQLMRGEAYLKMGNANALAEAQGIASGLMRNNPMDPEALVLRGRALYAQGDNPKAEEHFKKALNCDPEHRAAAAWLRIVRRIDRMKAEGNAEYRAGRWQPAADKYTDALEIDKANRGTNAKLLQNRALCRIKLGQLDAAIADCERAMLLDPAYLKARKTKTVALGQAGRWEESIKELRALHELSPDDPSLPRDLRRAELELKKSQRKDYYRILDVDKAADDNAIKKAYRKLAIIHHPDKNPDDPDAEIRFKDIAEAYETLSDPQKRARYDSGEDLVDAADMFGGGAGGHGMHGGIDPEVLFSMMNGGGFGGGAGGGSAGNPFAGAGGFRASGGFPSSASFSFGAGNGGAEPGAGGRQRGNPFPPGGYPFAN